MLAQDHRTMRPLDVRQVRTRAALRLALLDLSELCSFDDITVADIVERANVSPATFYRHYRDKSALLGDIASGFTHQLASKITAAAKGSECAIRMVAGLSTGTAGQAAVNGVSLGIDLDEAGQQLGFRHEAYRVG